VGIILPLTLISIFIVNTRSIAKQMTGKSQFSLFTGWQLANNALYMYGKVKVDSMQFTSIETREINRISYTFYKYAPSDFHDYLSEYVANFFIRQPQSPLKVYYSRHYRSRNELEAIKNWGKASLSYADFGKRLILSHPWAYMRYFVLLNTKNYFVPPLEKLEIYNLGDDEVGITAQDWFDYKTAEVTSISKTAQGNVLALFPYIFLFLNIFFIGSIAWMVINQNYKAVDKNLVRTFLITICLCLANFLFCITATIIVLRYEFFPMIILLALPLVLIDSIDSFVVVNKMQNTSSETKSNNLQVIQAPFINK
jgi:hypothetical protein